VCYLCHPSCLSWFHHREYTRQRVQIRKFLCTIWGSRSGDFCLLGYDVVQFVENQRTLWRNMLPSSKLKSKPSKKPAWSRLHGFTSHKIELLIKFYLLLPSVTSSVVSNITCF
jgi:hypothetical protein